MAARFASGYMQCEATEAGGASTHAWMEVYLPGAGWKGFDPTSGIMTGAQHVTVAVSRNPENAAPIAGSYQGPATAFQSIQVDVTVVQIDRPLPATPPATMPVLPSLPQQNQTQPNSARPVQQEQQMAQQMATAPAMDMVIQAMKPVSPAPGGVE